MKKKKRPTSSTFKYPMILESGTDEYRSKKKVEIERIDHRGIFRRARVTDQTVFDRLFIEEKITREQFSAAEMYLELMGIAGCFLRSPSMEGTERTSGRDIAGSMASKIMVIAKARDRLRKAGSEPLAAVETCLSLDKDVDINQLRIGLNALAGHFRSS